LICAVFTLLSFMSLTSGVILLFFEGRDQKEVDVASATSEPVDKLLQGTEGRNMLKVGLNMDSISGASPSPTTLCPAGGHPRMAVFRVRVITNY
jgi:hypothetical protein